MDKKSPEFHSIYHSCESNLFLEFSSLNVLLHQESLQELMTFAMDVQTDLNDIMASHQPTKTRISKSIVSRQTSEVGAKASAKFRKQK